jgi:oxygen-independent coproporphyrinogen-3 oxidase
VSLLTAAGLRVSLDLIYGTPGESLADWRTSLESAIALAPDHLSAYALTVEEGTKLAARVRRGEIPRPTDDDEADKYELADALLAEAGYHWYEVSNWARTPEDRCRHNLGYWDGSSWWGAGPGAHSHVGGVRWWNVKHPTAYESRVRAGLSPAAARETLTAAERYEEDVLLGVRLADGMPVGRLRAERTAAIPGLIADGLIDGRTALRDKKIRLTLRGRLLADTVVRQLVGE